MALHVTANHVSFRLTTISGLVDMAKKVLSNRLQKSRERPAEQITKTLGYILSIGYLQFNL